MKILIFVLTYLDNDIYSLFYEKQNKTWNSINVHGVETFFNINGGEKKEIREHFIINDLPETVPNEGYKIVNCFEKTLDWDYDYVFHTNSSSYVDKKLLYNWLLDKPRTNFYSGVRGHYMGHSFASGCGFAISKDVVRLILENQSKWEHGYADDATLGILLNYLGLQVYDAPRFDIVNIVDDIPNNYFHYRCKTENRLTDVNNLQRIHNLKLGLKG
jgi:hypothetical protein